MIPTGERLASRAERYAIDGTRVLLENLLVDTCDCITQMDFAFIRTSKHPAIRTERYVRSIICIPGEYPSVFTRDGIPQPDCIVPTPAGERLSIRTERNGNDRICMPFKNLPAFACDRIPKTDGLVRAATSDCPPIWTIR